MGILSLSIFLLVSLALIACGQPAVNNSNPNNMQNKTDFKDNSKETHPGTVLSRRMRYRPALPASTGTATRRACTTAWSVMLRSFQATKYDSGGWPDFYAPVENSNIREKRIPVTA